MLHDHSSLISLDLLPFQSSSTTVNIIITSSFCVLGSFDARDLLLAAIFPGTSRQWPTGDEYLPEKVYHANPISPPNCSMDSVSYRRNSLKRAWRAWIRWFFGGGEGVRRMCERWGGALLKSFGW